MTASQKLSQAKLTAKAMFAVAATVLTLSVSMPHAWAQNAGAVPPQQNAVQMQDDVRGVLTKYGRFMQHQRYGEVWAPTVTPQGWHPYMPCNWVNTKKYGWYYDDKTPWGAIVHHYGRWVHDADMGWIWTPGSEFSPGWVVWRTSQEWTGWAPMLPEQDIKTVSTAEFNNAANWIFVETQKFAQGCNASVQAPPQQVPMLLTETNYVTDVRLVSGITVIVLPGYVVGPWIDIDIVFGPWPNWFLAQTLLDWNFFWNNLAPMNVKDCPPVVKPKPLPVNNPVTPLPPRPVKPIDNGPPVVVPPKGPPVVVVVPPACPPGTFMDDGACRLPPEACRPGTVRVGNLCVIPTRPDPQPKPPVIDKPCDKLSGIELRRCLHGHPEGDGKPPVTGNGDGKPPGDKPGTGSTGHNPSVEPVGDVKPNKPNVILRPDRPQLDVPKNIRDNGPSKLPTTSLPGRPTPVVSGPSSGGVNKTIVGAAPQASNAPAHRPPPMALPEKKTVVR